MKKSKATESRINKLKDIIHKSYCLVNCVSLVLFQLDPIQMLFKATVVEQVLSVW